MAAWICAVVTLLYSTLLLYYYSTLLYYSTTTLARDLREVDDSNFLVVVDQHVELVEVAVDQPVGRQSADDLERGGGREKSDTRLLNSVCQGV